jgi:hypothetical protein
MTVVLLVDLEGVLFNNAQRLHLFKAAQWAEYETSFPDDTVYPVMSQFLSSVYWSTFELVIVTGRYQKYYDQTVEQMRKVNIHPEHLLMRDNFDIPKTKEPELKLQLLDEIKRLYPEPGTMFIALEDRDDVVEAYRNAGIECWQVRNGSIG